jgi:hypothetical protein
VSTGGFNALAVNGWDALDVEDGERGMMDKCSGHPLDSKSAVAGAAQPDSARGGNIVFTEHNSVWKLRRVGLTAFPAARQEG